MNEDGMLAGLMMMTLCCVDVVSSSYIVMMMPIMMYMHFQVFVVLLFIILNVMVQVI